MPSWWNGIHSGFKSRRLTSMRVRISPGVPMKYVTCHRTNDSHWDNIRILEFVSVFKIGKREETDILDGWYHNVLVGQNATAISPGYKELAPKHHHTYYLKYISEAEAETYLAFGLINGFENENEYSFYTIHFSI